MNRSGSDPAPGPARTGHADPLTELAALRAELERAERASDYKTWFIGQVSHEVRTPLNSILGFASLLAEEHGLMPEEQRSEYLQIILRNSRHVLHVLNDLLNLSKIEVGTLEVSLADVNAVEVAQAAVTALTPLAEERAIRVRIEVEGVAWVRADTGRLRQVLFNLLENAIKYSPRDSAVAVRVQGGTAGTRIEVRDRGPGIAPEDQEKLFKEFSRLVAQGKKVAGAGLGLALSKRLVELMGGEIGVQSATGEGSTFWVTLPPGRAPERLSLPTRVFSRPGELRPPPGGGRTVVVVDDEPDILALTRIVLERGGYTVVTDDGSRGVVDRVRGAGPELVLLDMNLAECTGADVLMAMRAEPLLATVPVVAFSASAGLERVVGGEAGFTGYLMKPVEPRALLEAVRTQLSRCDWTDEEEEYMGPLRARFREGLAGRRRELRRMTAEGDRDGVIREAHKLRGAAGGYGLPAVSAAAAEVEELLRGEGVGLDDGALVGALLVLEREMEAATETAAGPA